VKLIDQLAVLLDAEVGSGAFLCRAAACGVAHEHICSRCGGTGYYANLGVCYLCGGQNSRYWLQPKRITRELLTRAQLVWPAVEHAYRAALNTVTHAGPSEMYRAVKQERELAEQWVERGGPETREEWVRREGAHLAEYLGHQFRRAALNREKREEKEAREAGSIEIPREYEGKRFEIAGEILTTREQRVGPSWGGSTVTKCLVRVTTDEGWFKLWGTLPRAVHDAERGDRIVFTATLDISDRDSKFGFFSRPSKARKVS
jgi:hypothetical protein